MKTAMDYARQAIRFAERVTDDADALRADWHQAQKAGRRMASKKGVRQAVGAAASARADAAMAAHHARLARGWRHEQHAAEARRFACGAAWYAGFAAGVAATA